MTRTFSLARSSPRAHRPISCTRRGFVARIDREVKEEAATVLAAMGLTVSDAVRLLLTRVAREKALPFAPLVPNDETIAAMKEARAGHLPQFEDVNSLFDDLHAED